MKYAIGAIVLLLASLAMGQEIKHAPTVEQCRADAKVWVDDRHEGRYATSLTWHEMDARYKEMLDCSKVDRSFIDGYELVMESIGYEEEIRLENFIRRRGLWDQFTAEDAAGKR